jgi:hypothetical protein
MREFEEMYGKRAKIPLPAGDVRVGVKHSG